MVNMLIFKCILCKIDMIYMIYYYALKIKNQAMLFLMTFAGRKEPWMPQIIENFFENILFRYESCSCDCVEDIEHITWSAILTL
mgnify:CR=1 FL=1